MDKPSIRKPMLIMLISVGILFGGIFAYQLFKARMIKKYLTQQAAPAVSVTTTKATNQSWQPKITATGSLRAILGVDVTTELAGKVWDIYFKPGQKVTKNTLLVKLNDSTEVAQLLSLEAEAQLARINYERDKAQYEIKAVSQATLDTDIANLKSQIAQVEEQKSVVAKKNIRAPFSGRLGICLVDPGQYINPGDKIVTLQQLDPIYVDFLLPQQELVKIKVGQKIILTTDTYPDETFTGKITTINPLVDSSTRNVKVEATIQNPKELLYPGMFGHVDIDTGVSHQYITVPQNAISFNSYGQIAYKVTQKGTDKNNKPIYIAEQTFVETGDTRSNEITVLKGLNDGDTIVTSGQLKLKNGSVVTINNNLSEKGKELNEPDDAISKSVDEMEQKNE